MQLKNNIQVDQDNKNTHFELGRIYREKGNLDLSTREFKYILNSYKNNDFFINKLINELEINDKKVILESKPQAMIVMLSNKCNINCIMCGVKNKEWELPKKTIKEIIEYFPYLEYIQWQGGEVFLLSYFKDLFKEAARFPNIRQIINTNGLLITEDWAKDLIESKADITFSIDGVTKDVYEYIRKGAKFENLLKNIQHINEAKEKHGSSRTSINSVIMKSNYRQLESFIDFAHIYKFDSLTLARIDNNFDNKENIFYHKDLEAEHYIKNALPVIVKKAKDYRLDFISYLYPENEYNVSEDLTADENRGAICYLPWRELVIDVIGTRPDCRCIISAGDIFEMSLSDIWNGQIMQMYRKKLLHCDQKDFCRTECNLGVIPAKALKGIAVQ